MIILYLVRLIKKKFLQITKSIKNYYKIILNFE